jgi:hypothetical protein
MSIEVEPYLNAGRKISIVFRAGWNIPFGTCNNVCLSTHLTNVVLAALDCRRLEEWVQYQTNPNVDHPDSEGLTRQHIPSHPPSTSSLLKQSAAVVAHSSPRLPLVF